MHFLEHIWIQRWHDGSETLQCLSKWHCPMSHYSATRVRAALGHFVLGKALSAISSVLFLSLVVRNLSVAEYGAYAALLGFLGLICTVSSGGLESVVERFLPELRILADRRENQAVALLILLRVLMLAACSAIVVANIGLFAGLFDAPGWKGNSSKIATLIMLFGLLNLATSILDSRLQQKSSQLSFVVLIFVKVLVVLVALQGGGVDFGVVLESELAGYFFATLLALGALWRGRVKRYVPNNRRPNSEELRVRVVRFGAFNFGAQLLHQAQGPNALRLMAAAVGGAGAAASMGLVLQISELVQRYLPTTLLVRLIRPIFVSRYLASRDFQILNCFSGLLLKLNFIIVVPIVLVAILAGGPLLAGFSGGQYQGLGPLLTLSLVLVGIASHTSIISLLANTLEMNQLQFQGGVFSIVGAAVGFGLAKSYGEAGLLIGAILFGFLYNSFAILILRRKGFDYRPPFSSAWRIVAIAGVTFGWIVFIVGADYRLAVQLALGAVCASAYAVLFFYFVPFSFDERRYLSRVVPEKASRYILR